MTSLVIIDRRIAAFEKAGNSECSSFDISVIGFIVFTLFAPLLSNVLCKGTKEADNFRSTEWRNRYPTLSVLDFDSEKKLQNWIQYEQYPSLSTPIAPLDVGHHIEVETNSS